MEYVKIYVDEKTKDKLDELKNKYNANSLNEVIKILMVNKI
jgi:Ribbon-helix-helix protein, copG family.